MSEFNLVDKPWIPCIGLDGKQSEAGIYDTLLNAHELREIYDDSPLVTVAIHRLLLAILYRVHSGPKSFAEWRRLYQRAKFDRRMVSDYLNQWRVRFSLFAGKYPFFQMGGLETTRAVSINRLATECASGNNATLFDHSGDQEEVTWPPAQAAKRLLACQSFALGFGKSGNAKINGKDEALPYSADAIALRGMNIWMQGPTLFGTLMVNLAPAEDKSLPPWELNDPHQYRDRCCGKGRKVVTSLGVVDRLTWQSRLVRLIPNGATVSRMFFTQGRSADKSAGDPMKVYRVSKEEGISALPLSSAKAAWRDAHSILTIPVPDSQERRPECFNLLARARAAGAIEPDKRFVVHIVGLASAPNKAGKFLLWRHERMPIRAALLGDTSLIERLGTLLQGAGQGASELYSRAKRIARFFRVPDGHEPSQNEWDDINKVVDDIDPRPAYWARLETHFFDLLENLPNDWDAASDNWKPDEQQVATYTWRDHVKDEARRALEEGIRSLGTTARAIQAVARIRTDFNDDDLKPPPPKTDRAKQKGKGGKKK
ncbi:MAG: type I-E CRISPR-associated protein Cse1/CasA [Planctomycetes bacterium]|nr:type I-E CRISPR-associated protein Cse1/CasA [Planctomycetota bacterium]